MKKIMLCCNAGMSTSLLVQKMQAEVANRGLDIEVEARPMNEAHDHLDECDMLLLGPQIGYTKGDFEKEAAGRSLIGDQVELPVRGLEGKAYGDTRVEPGQGPAQAQDYVPAKPAGGGLDSGWKP